MIKQIINKGWKEAYFGTDGSYSFLALFLDMKKKIAMLAFDIRNQVEYEDIKNIFLQGFLDVLYSTGENMIIDFNGPLKDLWEKGEQLIKEAYPDTLLKRCVANTKKILRMLEGRKGLVEQFKMRYFWR